MASSAMGLKLEVFEVLPITYAKTNKTNASTIFARCAVFYTCLSSCSDRSRCRWHTHPINYGYFDYWKKPENPQFEPHAGIEIVQVLGSLLYICASVLSHKSNFVMAASVYQHLLLTCLWTLWEVYTQVWVFLFFFLRESEILASTYGLGPHGPGPLIILKNF